MDTTTKNFPGTPLMRAIAGCIVARVPGLVKGDPGLGKTAKLDRMATSWGYYFESITGSNREATDFLGLPYEGEHTSPDGSKKRVQASLSLDWATRLNDEASTRPDAGSVLFLDEINLQEDSMKAMLRVLEERFAGPDKFADNVAILAAMNPTNVSTGGFDLPAAIANRVIHFDWHHDHDAWTEGFLNGFQDVTYPSLDALLGERGEDDKVRVRASIAQFLNTFPALRNACPSDDPEAAAGPWPSIRMWTKASEVLSMLHPDDDEAARLVLFGAVGKAAAVEYLTWRDKQDLYDPMAVLRGEVEVDWNDRRLDRLYVLAMSLRALVQGSGDADDWKAAMKVMAKGQSKRPDVAWQGVYGLLQVKPEKAPMPREVVSAFAEQMDRVGLTTAA